MGKKRQITTNNFRSAIETITEHPKVADYNTDVAQNGKNALKAIETLKSDLLLVDLMLPKMEGIEILRDVKERSWGLATSC